MGPRGRRRSKTEKNNGTYNDFLIIGKQKRTDSKGTRPAGRSLASMSSSDLGGWQTPKGRMRQSNWNLWNREFDLRGSDAEGRKGAVHGGKQILEVGDTLGPNGEGDVETIGGNGGRRPILECPAKSTTNS